MERQRCHLSFTVHSQNAHIARTVLDWSQECKLSPDLYMSVRDPNFWANTCCLPVCTVAGSWSWKWSWYSKPSVLIMGCEHLKQCLNYLNQMFIPSLLFDYLSNVSWSLGNVGTWFFSFWFFVFKYEDKWMLWCIALSSCLKWHIPYWRTSSSRSHFSSSPPSCKCDWEHECLPLIRESRIEFWAFGE